MKFLFAVAAAGILSSLTAITPANAQKDPACTEKCNRQNTAAGGGQQTRGTGEAIRACIASCPPAKKKSSLHLLATGNGRLALIQGRPPPPRRPRPSVSRSGVAASSSGP